jgi:hypothetical protein
VERVFGGNLERNTKRDKREKEVLNKYKMEVNDENVHVSNINLKEYHYIF